MSVGLGRELSRVPYPAWICHDCGAKHGRVIQGHLATFHEGDACGWCGEVTGTTEPRDYGYPKVPGVKVIW